MAPISYETLYNSILAKLPNSPLAKPIIRELLSDQFDPRLVCLDPYHELLPAYYSFHEKGLHDSDCNMNAGIKHTTCLLHNMQNNGDAASLSHLVIASCIHDIPWTKLDLTEPLPDNFLSAAKKHLSQNNYPLWHHSSKNYLPPVVPVVTTASDCFLVNIVPHTYADKLATCFVAHFSAAFLSYDILYHGYTEHCYQKAEEYKLSLLSRYLS